MRISHSGKKPVILTAGDPRGIGPEVILKSLAGFSPARKINLLIVGDYGVFKKAAKRLKIKIPPVRFIDLKNAPLSAIDGNDKLCGRASMEYLSFALSIIKKNKDSSLVTAPINKAAINKAGYRFDGHTEFLAHATKSKKVTMMLVGGRLRVSLVTRHLAIKEVAKFITGDKIIETAENTYYALKKFFKIPHPRIGIAALNPHAGERGLLGKEEALVISPAIRHLRKKIKGIFGPLPADTLFYKAYRGELDAVVAMYHDQGLIPLKMTAFDTGVNLTLGLPFIRTSPDHGTGFDIAGKGKASPSSMIEAIKLAAKLSQR